MHLQVSKSIARLLHYSIAYGLMALTILTTILSVSGYFGRLNRYVEMSSAIRHVYLLIGTITLIYFVLTRRRIWIWVSLLCVLINAVEVLPWHFPKPKVIATDIPASIATMRVFMFNVLHENTRYQDAIALVNQEKPTLAVFLEATKPWPEELTQLKQTFPYHFSAEKIQIEIYSKVPLIAPEIRLYGKKRGLAVSKINVNGQEVMFIATHAYPQTWFGQQGFEWRNQQLEEGIGDFVGQLQQPVVLVGDLNATMWSPHYKSMIRRSGLINARQGFGVLPTLGLPTFYHPLLAFPVDHCLVSPKVEVEAFRTGPFIGSDHLPIIADVKINA
jgi:endonuclease/exonuclease/phosphatase (EEP) superfamily protein YafD